MPDIVRLRNITTDDLLVAPLQRIVRADCVVDIARPLYEQYAWPEAVWRDETPTKPRVKG